MKFKRPYFLCRECKTKCEIGTGNPVNSAGCCRTCGTRNWIIVNENKTVIG